uniref:Uncharacterized protein n=1 Tax=Oryzias sinensis TaxID=183150 RepID=A0A8C7X411_9TELE
MATCRKIVVRSFQAKWTNAYFVVPHRLDKITGAAVKRTAVFVGVFYCKNKLQQLQRGYAAHQIMFTKMAKSSDAVREASSYVVDVFKVFDIVYQEQKKKFEELSLSNDTFTRQVEDLALNLQQQLENIWRACYYKQLFLFILFFQQNWPPV